MYGKFFASTFTGSMFGAGPDVFAVWGYVIANAWDSTVELNPQLLAAVLGATPERIEAAILALTGPDPKSRNPAEGGRRLSHEGGFSYRVVSHEIYRNIRNEDDRRTYNREAQRRSRANRRSDVSNRVNPSVNDMSALSAQTEAEAELEGEEDLEKAQAPLAAPASPSPTPLELVAPTPRKKAEKAKSEKPQKWRFVPEDWQPNAKHRDLAKDLGVDFASQLAQFRDWEFRAPKTDADRAFSAWLRRSPDFGTGAAKANLRGPQPQRGVADGVNLKGDSSWLNK